MWGAAKKNHLGVITSPPPKCGRGLSVVSELPKTVTDRSPICRLGCLAACCSPDRSSRTMTSFGLLAARMYHSRIRQSNMSGSFWSTSHFIPAGWDIQPQSVQQPLYTCPTGYMSCAVISHFIPHQPPAEQDSPVIISGQPSEDAVLDITERWTPGQ